MDHWIVNSPGTPVVASWKEALPGARVLTWSELPRLLDAGEGIIWCRVRQECDLNAALGELRRFSGLPVVVFSDEPDEAQAAKAISAGASGFCNSHAAPGVLRQIAVVVENGGLWLGQALVQRLVTGTSRLLANRPLGARERWSDGLSDREKEVALKVATGASNREIADQLFITERTVKAHLSTIFEKLGVRDRLQLSLRVNGAKV